MACLVWHRFPTAQLFGAPQHPRSPSQGLGLGVPHLLSPGGGRVPAVPSKKQAGQRSWWGESWAEGGEPLNIPIALSSGR